MAENGSSWARGVSSANFVVLLLKMSVLVIAIACSLKALSTSYWTLTHRKFNGVIWLLPCCNWWPWVRTRSSLNTLITRAENPVSTLHIAVILQLIVVMAAFQTLAGLEAISGPTVITPLGRRMLHYPLDPSHARILLSSFTHSCASEIIDILSLAVSGSIWTDRSSERESSAKARQKFLSREGDHLTGMNVFRAYMAIKEDKSESPQKWAKENYVNIRTLQSALKVREQLRELAQREGMDPTSSCGGETDNVGKCLLSGLFMNTAVVQSDGTYKQTMGILVSRTNTYILSSALTRQQVKIHPSSVLMSKKVPAILYDELVRIHLSFSAES